MGRLIAIPTGLLAIVTVCSACFICSSMALFLRTVYALTNEERIAQVVMYPIQRDENGEYIEIEYIPYRNRSALFSVFNSEDEGSSETELELGRPQSYRIYGDVVAVRGPLITLHPLLHVIGFGNVYKLALIEGEYRRSNDGEGTEIIINGGFDNAWWNINDNESEFPYNTYIKRVTFSGDEEPGFRGNGVRRYDIVVTIDSITWNRIGNE